MTLHPLPAFVDNYIWMLHDGRSAWVVDPGACEPVLAALDAQGLELAGILVTHHHGDHVGGLAALLPRLRGPIFAPAHEDMPVPCERVQGGDTVQALGMPWQVLDVPGHTRGHIAYYTAATTQHTGVARPVLFCGDTLFSGGCGRLFEGTPEQMHVSLQTLAALPGDTAVCCAHEYTVSNLRFAQAVEPHNPALARYAAWCDEQRLVGRPTLPSAIETERQVNPFLRCSEPDVVAAARRREPDSLSPADVLGCLRRWKNDFR
jgi:hydroxyacylglutathione hydrolase